MFQHLLIPVDFTGKNRAALAVGEEMARQNAARVTLLHVVETLEDEVDDELRGFYGQLERRARDKLVRLEQELTGRQVQVAIAVAFGKRAEEIVRHAVDHAVDLIVLSSHELGSEEARRGWPTVSHQVALISPKPVLLVR